MKPIIILLLFISLSSCRTYYRLGETESEFLSQNKNIRFCIEEASYSRTILRRCDGYGHFFYFEGGRLVEINMGTYVPDATIIIEER